jgi:anhydro-N-acetylmuramic acid kinase
MPTRLIAGAMSGTSADGIDVAIVAIDGRGTEMSAKLVRHVHQPYDPELRRAIFALRGSGQVALPELARCGREISLAYAVAVRKALVAANLDASDLAAIAAHGQTLFHDPPNTIQWIDPALLAAEIRCPVVSDFRRADCAAGGQGAPLVPFGDYIIFHHPTRDRAVVNLGGIANITFLPAGAPLEKTLAFDTGPGNCISDYLMREHDPDGPGVDHGGQLASRGNVVRELFDAFLDDGYFRLSGPKSTDGPQMIDTFLKARKRVASPIPLPDLLATACALTAELVRASLRALGAGTTMDVIVAGGGTQNQTLMRQLEGARTSDEFGVPTDAREAIAFALLGAATLDNVPANVPSCTGASRPVVLGAITPRP